MKVLEISAWEFHFEIDEWNNGRKARTHVAIARLVWIGFAGNLLAVELGASGNADGVSVLSALVGVCARRGRAGGAPDGQLALDEVASRFCAAVRGLVTGVVDFRGHQSPHRELGVSGKQQVHGARILRALHVVVLDGDAGRVRNGGIGTQFSLGGIFQFGAADPSNAATQRGHFSNRNGDVRSDVDLAEVLLPFCLDIALVDSGADQSLVGQAELSGFFARGQLAADCVAVAGSTHLRILLGDVELLFVAEVDLSHSRSAVSARVRNAVAGISWVYSFRVGVVRVEKFHLAEGAAAIMKRWGERPHY